MNHTFHIILKDLSRMRWALAIWILCLVYLLFQSRLQLGLDNLGDFLQLSAIMLSLVAGVGLIADLMQSDHPTLSEAHWRALPISAGRLVTAKLLLLLGLFVVLPVGAALVRNLVAENSPFRNLRHLHEIGWALLILGAVNLSYAAVAACTRNVVHSLGLWLGLIFATGTLASYLGRYAPVLPREAYVRMGSDKPMAVLTLSVVIALAVILNQYLRRRVTASILLLLAGTVGAALIGTLWGYFYFYSAQ
ncbi:MAG: hypothetical protein ACOZE5_02180 [Verrucomicrobiota bacterium]